MEITPNRIVAAGTVALGILGAVLVPLANMDLTSAAGVIAGLGAATLAALKWLDGWQKHEERTAFAEQFVVDDRVAGPSPEVYDG
jgi:hypothetical protein